MRPGKLFFQPITRLLENVQRRFRISRPGSVLILVVALLVLLALVGTATLTTTRIDRYTTVQHTNNTQIELLLEGVKNMAKATIVGDLFDLGSSNPVTFRHYNATYEPLATNFSTYGPWTAPDLKTALTNGTYTRPNQKWLSIRNPTVYDVSAVPDMAANPPFWLALGAPLTGTEFAAPFAVEVSSGQLATNVALTYTDRVSSAVRSPAFAGRNFIPVSITQATVGGVTQTFSPPLPAWRLTSAGPGGLTYLYPAGDADGDGIADSGFFKLPVGELNGLTYYAAVRIIDNGSAINVNTAWSSQFDFSGDGSAIDPQSLAMTFFPSNVGLAELLHTWTAAAGTSALSGAASMGSEIDYLNWSRWGRTGAVSITAAQLPNGVGNRTPDTTPVADSVSPFGTAARNDFRYLTIGEALARQLTARLGYPGFDTLTTRYEAFGLQDAVALSYRFVSVNPDASPSPLEQLLIDATGGLSSATRDSVYKSAWNYGGTQRAYDPGAALTWYDDNFHLAEETTGGDSTVAVDVSTFKPRRWMLTTHSPVSNLISARNTASSSTGSVDDTPMKGMVSTHLPAGESYHKINGQPIAAKTNINTADFGELWRGFWSVMAGAGGETPYGPDPIDNPPAQDPPTWANGGPAHSADPYRGSKFDQPGAQTNPSVSGSQDADKFMPQPGDHIQRMFRSSVRDHGTTGANARRLSSSQQMTLRAALAAANAVSMRSFLSRDPLAVPYTTAIPVEVRQGTGAPIVGVARIFGAKVQPFITEIYANTDTGGDPALPTDADGPNPNGFVAIEIYNPYPRPHDISNYRLIAINRTTAGANKDVSAAATIYTFPTGTFVPAQGFLVIDSWQDPAGGTTIAGGSMYRSPSSGMPLEGPIADGTDPGRTDDASTPEDETISYRYLSVPQLTQTGGPNVYNSEVVLVRDVNTVTSGIWQQPIDSFDFTGLSPTAIGGGAVPPPTAWHYVRETNQGTLDPWRFLYPGRYDGGLAERRHQGTQAATWTPVTGDPDTGDPWDRVNNPTAIQPNPAPTLNSFSPHNGSASYNPRFPFQLLNGTGPAASLDQPGFNPLTAAPGNRFPFGGFARNSDMLQVPFVGAYQIVDSAGNTIELNSISMDSAFADDTDLTDDPNVLAPNPYSGPVDDPIAGPFTWREQLGRFAPVVDTLPSPNALSLIDDSQLENGAYDKDRSAMGAGEVVWRYRWATRLYEYLTVNTPHDDYQANAKPATYSGGTGLPTPVPVSNSGGVPGDSGSITPANPFAELTEPLQGLVNINTASWRVLAQIPWVPPRQGGGSYHSLDYPGSTLSDNEFIAKAIVQWRDGIQVLPATYGIPVGKPDATTAAPYPPGGPFTSIFDLYRVQAFRELQGRIISLVDPSAREGDFSGTRSRQLLPFTPDGTHFPDGVRFDVDERFLLLNRVSNLITTQADGFTVYIQLQGWRNVGVPNTVPTLEVERRAAFIADRSTVTPGSSQLRTISIPTE